MLKNDWLPFTNTAYLLKWVRPVWFKVARKNNEAAGVRWNHTGFWIGLEGKFRMAARCVTPKKKSFSI